jgi:hypothetical protein
MKIFKEAISLSLFKSINLKAKCQEKDGVTEAKR